MFQTARGDEGAKRLLRREEEGSVIHVIFPQCFEIRQCFSFIGEGKKGHPMHCCITYGVLAQSKWVY